MLGLDGVILPLRAFGLVPRFPQFELECPADGRLRLIVGHCGREGGLNRAG